MLKTFDREDVETLWKLVKAKHRSTRPDEGYKRVLWGDLKVLFEPYVEDEVWKMQQRYNVVRWMLFNSCRVHCLRKKLTDLKNKSFDYIKKMFNRAFKRVNTFVDYKAELVEESSKKAEAEVMEQESLKRAGIELEQESSKKQKIDDDKETIELKQLVKIILDEKWVAIDVIPLAVKPPSIVDWKIHKEGKKSYY
nr:hypothetical protein [Tanacetum cinerariifolium]